jgi:hypothetical protein
MSRRAAPVAPRPSRSSSRWRWPWAVGPGTTRANGDRTAACQPTAADALAPFYEPNAPVRDKVGTGYVLSGRVVSSGRPVGYEGRPPHIHLRITAPDHPPLVTQHYPEEGTEEARFDITMPSS